jgi:hypothetical protein
VRIKFLLLVPFGLFVACAADYVGEDFVVSGPLSPMPKTIDNARCFEVALQDALAIDNGQTLAQFVIAHESESIITTDVAIAFVETKSAFNWSSVWSGILDVNLVFSDQSMLRVCSMNINDATSNPTTSNPFPVNCTAGSLSQAALSGEIAHRAGASTGQMSLRICSSQHAAPDPQPTIRARVSLSVK